MVSMIDKTTTKEQRVLTAGLHGDESVGIVEVWFGETAENTEGDTRLLQNRRPSHPSF